MLEHSKQILAEAPSNERGVAEAVALRFLASQLEENLMSPNEAAKTAQARCERSTASCWVCGLHNANACELPIPRRSSVVCDPECDCRLQSAEAMSIDIAIHCHRRR